MKVNDILVSHEIGASTALEFVGVWDLPKPHLFGNFLLLQCLEIDDRFPHLWEVNPFVLMYMSLRQMLELLSTRESVCQHVINL